MDSWNKFSQLLLENNHIKYTEISTSEGDLEDVFVKLTSR